MPGWFDINVFIMLHSLQGHSWIFDSLVSMATGNTLMKSGVIGGSFIAAWFASSAPEAMQTRKVLVLTIVAGVISVAVGKGVATQDLSARPILYTAPVYELDRETLEPAIQLNFRVPLDDAGQARHRAMASGRFEENDLRSFPSDHALLFAAIATGIWIAHRTAGLIAISWTLLVVLLPRIISGAHWPTDIIAGAMMGGMIAYLLVRFVVPRKVPGIDELMAWALARPVLSNIVMFIVIFEVCSTFDNVRPIMGFLRQVAARAVGG